MKEDADKKRRALESGRRARELIGQTEVDGTNVFLTPQQNAIGAITLLDTIITAMPVHVTPTLNKMKTMIAATIPDNSGGDRQPSASVYTPSGSRLPPLRSRDYNQPDRSMTKSRQPHGGRAQQELSIHSSAGGHKDRYAESEYQHSPRAQPRVPIDLRDTINHRRQERNDR